MNGWLLDTNVLSEMRRPRPSRRVVEFISSKPADRLYVSSASIAEIRVGIEAINDPIGRGQMIDWLDRSIRPMFEGRVLELTEDLLVSWLLLVDSERKRRRTLPYPDALIAATAAHHGLTVATRNVRDFEPLGVPVLNPWMLDP